MNKNYFLLFICIFSLSSLAQAEDQPRANRVMPQDRDSAAFTLTNNRTGKVFYCNSNGGGNAPVEERVVELGIFGDRNCRDHDAQITFIYAELNELKEKCLSIAQANARHLSDTEAIKINGKCFNTTTGGFGSPESFASECVEKVRIFFATNSPQG